MRTHGVRDDRPGRRPGTRRGASAAVGAPAGLLDVRTVAGVLALQHTAGNAAVARALAEARHVHGSSCGHQASVQRSAVRTTPTVARTVQRMTDEGGPSSAAAAQVAVVVTPEEVRILQEYQQTTTDPTVQNLLNELMPHLHRVIGWQPQDTMQSGGTTRRFDDGTYTVQYGGGLTGDDRLATLVHELTHVVIDQAYDSDMLNYPVPPLTDEDRADTERDWNDEGTRQSARLGKANRGDKNRYIDMVLDHVARLVELLPGSGLPEATQRNIQTKLENHTSPKPFHEYDAVLSHLLTLCDTSGVNRNSPFYIELTAMVRQASGWRKAGRIDLPQPAGAPAPGPGAPAPANAAAARDRGCTPQVMAVLRKLSSCFGE